MAILSSTGAELPPGTQDAASGKSDNDVVKDSDERNFVHDVVEASKKVPVLVDFWAPWCGPCKQLGPVLEKVVHEARGAVRLVKIDIDKNPSLAQQLRVQSIPTVFIFHEGRVLNMFQGALPESQLRKLINELKEVSGFREEGGGEPVEEALAKAEQLLESGETRAAQALFQRIEQIEAGNSRAIAGSLRCQVQLGDLEGARLVLDGLSGELRGLAPIVAASALLDLVEKGAGGEQAESLRKRLDAQPDDLDTRFAFACALAGLGDFEHSVDELLEIISRDREWNDQAARGYLLKIFDALGGEHPLVEESRRRLAKLLFS